MSARIAQPKTKNLSLVSDAPYLPSSSSTQHRPMMLRASSELTPHGKGILNHE